MSKHLRLGKLLWMFGFLLTFLAVSGGVGYAQLRSFALAGKNPTVTKGVIDNVAHTVTMQVPTGTLASLTYRPTMFSFSTGSWHHDHHARGRMFWTGGMYTGTAANLFANRSLWLMQNGRDYHGTNWYTRLPKNNFQVEDQSPAPGYQIWVTVAIGRSSHATDWVLTNYLVSITEVSSVPLSNDAEIMTYSLTGTPPVTTPEIADPDDGIDQVANTVEIFVPYGEMCTGGALSQMMTEFTVSPGATLYWTNTEYLGTGAALFSGHPDWLMTTMNDHNAGWNFNYSCANDQDGNPDAPTTIWLTVRAENGYIENYRVIINELPASPEKVITDLDGNTDASNIISGLKDCYGDAKSTIVGQPVANQLGGYDYTITLIKGADYGQQLDFAFAVSEFATASAPGSSPAMTNVGLEYLAHKTFANDLSGVANAFIITVTAQDLSTADYRFIPNWVTGSTAKELTSFSLLIPKVIPSTEPYFEAVGVLNAATKTYTVHVPYGTNVATAQLAAKFTLNDQYAIMTHSEDAKLRQVSGTTLSIVGATTNNYKDPNAFTIYDQGCNTLEYFVVVIEDGNRDNDLLGGTIWFKYRETCDNSQLDKSSDLKFNGVAGSISGVTVVYLDLPYEFDLTDIITELEVSLGATVDPSDITSFPFAGVPGENEITITAANGVAQRIYRFDITILPPSTEAKILSFDFDTDHNPGIGAAKVVGAVHQETHRIDLIVPWGTDVTELIASFTNSPFSCVFVNGPGQTDHTRQTSGVTDNSFTLPLTYTVVAQDGVTEGYYNVVVTFVPADTHNELTGLGITGQLDCLGASLESEITGAYVVRMRNGRDASTSLTVNFTKPALSTCNIPSGYVWTPAGGNTLNIVITSESGTPATYTITKNWVTPSDKKAITYFAFEPLVAGKGNAQLRIIHGGAINEAAKTVTVHVPYGTDVTALKATYTLDDKYARLTHSEESFDLRVAQSSGLTPINYTTPAAFTVYDEACNTVEYFVTVIVDPNAGNDITGFTFTGKEYRNCETLSDTGVAAGYTVTQVGNAFTITVAYGTNMSSFDLDWTKSLGATCSPNPTSLHTATFGVPVTLTVTAADGVASKVYTLTFLRAAALSGTQLTKFGFEDHTNGLTADAWTATPINHNTLRIDVELPFGKSLASLISSFEQSPMACVYINGPGITDKTLKTSGVGPGNDYTHAVTYTVVAQNGNEAYYNIYVKNAPAATDKWIHAFVVTGLPRCFPNLTYDLGETATALGVVTRDGNNINISVKYGTDWTNLNVGFAIPTTATVSPNPATTHNFSSPVIFTVTAQDGSTIDYTVTVTRRAINNEKKILTYKIAGSTSSVIDEAAKKIEVWVPWATNLDGLVASFTLSTGAEMTHSEDVQVLQVTGVTPNNFTTPVAYTVWSESCQSVEYFVTVHITPDVNTGISQFSFSTTGCGCDLGTKIDSYARRIYVKIQNRDANGALISLSSLAPAVIGIANGASISPAVTAAQNWNNGPVKYTVTAPDGLTKADWYVSVANPPCTATDILTWKFVEGPGSTTTMSSQVGNAVVDATAHTITVTLKPDTDVKSLYALTTLSCGASICCNAGGCAGTAIDFSETMCHVCVVKAQDLSVTQDWTICLKYQDLIAPVVTTWSVMAYNCLDSVAVKSNEAGRVFLVNESKIVNNIPVYNLADWTGAATVATSVAKMVADRMGAYSAITLANDTVYVQTAGLYSGIYYAYSVDNSGNISCISAQRVYLDICDVEVKTMCDLRALPVVYRYTLSGEVFVTYEETRVGGNLKYVQDATCGIKILDKLNGLDLSYGVGKGLKNLRGMLDNSGVELTFIPDCCYKPTASSAGNVVAPIELTWDQFFSSCYATTSPMYESMLVKITTPMIAFDDYEGPHLNWMYDNMDLATINAMGGYEYFIQSVFNSSLIGTAIPTVPAYYTGIRTNVSWSGTKYGLITPRKTADIQLLSAPVITANPNPALISGVVVGNCGKVDITIYNEGLGNSSITALYLDDAAATDGFNLLLPPAVPFTLGTWGSKKVTVNFCPIVAGNKTTYLVVEYGVGKTLRVPINGTTMLIYPIRFSEDFNGGAPPAAWNFSNMTYANNGYNLTNNSNGFTRWGNTGYTPSILITPGIDLTTASHPVLSFWLGTYFNSNFQVDISNDYNTWTTIKNYGWFTQGNGVGKVMTLDLTPYVGKVVYIRFLSTFANYYGIDDVVVEEQVTVPIPIADPAIANLGGVQVGQSGTLHVTFKNKGVSILKVKKVEIVGPSQFSLTDTNTYPVEVTNNGFYAYSINGKESVEFDVAFSPTDIGVKTGKIVITYGLYEDQKYEIPMTGEGLSCYTAAVATKGQNYAPSQNTWFKYTADKFSIVQITSCDPHQDLVTTEYAWDTFLYVYSDCTGTLIASNDDMEAACVYNRASSSVQTTVNAGETIYIFWPLAFPTALYAYDGFYFNINVSYPVDGDVCENAIPLTLPVINHFGTTRGFNDDYNISPCSPFSNYMDGNDKVYTITLPYEGYLTASILGAYGSIHVLDVCPVETLEKFHCKLFIGGPNGGSIEKKIAAGTYFVIISTWSPPQTVDFLMNLTFRGTGVDNSELMSKLNVYPNPTDGKFTVSISNNEALDMTLELVNISGQVVYRNEVKAAYNYNEEIDATLFAKGVYYLKVNNGKGVKIEKVVIE